MILHVVLFRFHENTTPIQVEDARRALMAMKGAISEIRGISFGPNLAQSGDEWPYALVVQLDHMAAVGRYLAHPVHVDAVAKYVTPILAARLAADLEAP